MTRLFSLTIDFQVIIAINPLSWLWPKIGTSWPFSPPTPCNPRRWVRITILLYHSRYLFSWHCNFQVILFSNEDDTNDLWKPNRGRAGAGTGTGRVYVARWGLASLPTSQSLSQSLIGRFKRPSPLLGILPGITAEADAAPMGRVVIPYKAFHKVFFLPHTCPPSILTAGGGLGRGNQRRGYPPP